MSSSPIPPASPADKARIRTFVQPCLTAQGQAVTAAEADIETLLPVSTDSPTQNKQSLRGRRGNDQRI